MITWITKRFLFAKSSKQYRSTTVWIASIGIIAASFFVFLSLGVLSGYQSVYRDAVLNFNAHLIVYDPVGVSEELQERIEKHLDVSPYKSVYSPYHIMESLVPSKEGFQPILFKGFDLSKKSDLYLIPFKQGDNSHPNGVILGSRLEEVQKNSLNGKPFRFLKMRDPEGRFQTSSQAQEVWGTFESGYYEFDSRLALTSLENLYDIFSISPTVSGYEVRLKDFSQIGSLKSSLLREFNQELEIQTWNEWNKNLFEALTLDRTVVFTVSGLILVVACLNIFGFSFLFFLRRKREFLILAALGLSLRKLKRVLMLISGLLGTGAALIGAMLAVLALIIAQELKIPLDPKVYFVDHIPVEMNWPWFLGFLISVSVFSILTSALAGRLVLNRWVTRELIEL